MKSNSLINKIDTIAKEVCNNDCFDCPYSYDSSFFDDDFGEVPTKHCMFDAVGTNYTVTGLSEEGEELYSSLQEVCDSYPSVDQEDICDYCPLHHEDGGCICNSAIFSDIKDGKLVLVKED